MRRGGPHHPTLLMRAMCARRDTLIGLPVVTRAIDATEADALPDRRRWPNARRAIVLARQEQLDRELDRSVEPAPPSSPRCLVAAGLGARPNGRER